MSAQGNQLAAESKQNSRAFRPSAQIDWQSILPPFDQTDTITRIIREATSNPHLDGSHWTQDPKYGAVLQSLAQAAQKETPAAVLSDTLAAPAAIPGHLIQAWITETWAHIEQNNALRYDINPEAPFSQMVQSLAAELTLDDDEKFNLMFGGEIEEDAVSLDTLGDMKLKLGDFIISEWSDDSAVSRRGFIDIAHEIGAYEDRGSVGGRFIAGARFNKDGSEKLKASPLELACLYRRAPKLVSAWVLQLARLNHEGVQATTLTALTAWCDGLRKGNKHHKGSEHTAGQDAYDAILVFSNYLESISPTAKDKVLSLQNADGDSVREIWTVCIEPNKARKKGGRQGANFCIQLRGAELHDIIVHNQTKLSTNKLNQERIRLRAIQTAWKNSQEMPDYTTDAASRVDALRFLEQFDSKKEQLAIGLAKCRGVMSRCTERRAMVVFIIEGLIACSKSRTIPRIERLTEIIDKCHSCVSDAYKDLETGSKYQACLQYWDWDWGQGEPKKFFAKSAQDLLLGARDFGKLKSSYRRLHDESILESNSVYRPSMYQKTWKALVMLSMKKQYKLMTENLLVDFDPRKEMHVRKLIDLFFMANELEIYFGSVDRKIGDSPYVKALALELLQADIVSPEACAALHVEALCQLEKFRDDDLSQYIDKSWDDLGQRIACDFDCDPDFALTYVDTAREHNKEHTLIVAVLGYRPDLLMRIYDKESQDDAFSCLIRTLKKEYSFGSATTLKHLVTLAEHYGFTSILREELDCDLTSIDSVDKVEIYFALHNEQKKGITAYHDLLRVVFSASGLDPKGPVAASPSLAEEERGKSNNESRETALLLSLQKRVVAEKRDDFLWDSIVFVRASKRSEMGKVEFIISLLEGNVKIGGEPGKDILDTYQYLVHELVELLPGGHFPYSLMARVLALPGMDFQKISKLALSECGNVYVTSLRRPSETLCGSNFSYRTSMAESRFGYLHHELQLLASCVQSRNQEGIMNALNGACFFACFFLGSKSPYRSTPQGLRSNITINDVLKEKISTAILACSHNPSAINVLASMLSWAQIKARNISLPKDLAPSAGWAAERPVGVQLAYRTALLRAIRMQSKDILSQRALQAPSATTANTETKQGPSQKIDIRTDVLAILITSLFNMSSRGRGPEGEFRIDPFIDSLKLCELADNFQIRSRQQRERAVLAVVVGTLFFWTGFAPVLLFNYWNKDEKQLKQEVRANRGLLKEAVSEAVGQDTPGLNSGQ